MKTVAIWCHVYLWVTGESSASGSGADCKLGLTIVRPDILTTPEPLGNWMDSRISCQHSVWTSFLVFN